MSLICNWHFKLQQKMQILSSSHIHLNEEHIQASNVLEYSMFLENFKRQGAILQ